MNIAYTNHVLPQLDCVRKQSSSKIPASILLPALIAAAFFIMFGLCFATDTLRNPTKKKGAGPLFQIRHDGRWGYMNRNGKTVIPPEFEDEGDFFGGLARVESSGKWGYIDETANIVIPLQFESAADFRDRLAPVQLKRLWGFIDPSGKFVVSPQFQSASEFSQGLARFEVWDTIRCGRDSYTKENAPLYAFRSLDTQPVMSGGCFSENARYGFIDRLGNVTIAPKFVVAGNFSEGLAAVKRSSGSKYGYIDINGKTVIEPQFDQACSFSEGLAAVEFGFSAEGGKKVAGKWGFVNHSGSFVMAPRFEMARGFSEGLAEVSVESGQWGYVDKQGGLVIPAKYLQTEAFSEGIALVWPEGVGNGYYINKAGRRTLTLGLQPQWSFSDGLTIAGDVGQRKYVDRTGRIVGAYEIDLH